MKKSKKIIIVIIIFFIVIISISSVNRGIYGTWSVFSYPERVSYGGYRYYNSKQIVTLTDSEKPQYEVSQKIDKFTGKKIYSNEKDFIGCGKVVYLHLDSNRYLVLGSGGGGWYRVIILLFKIQITKLKNKPYVDSNLNIWLVLIYNSCIVDFF